MLLSGEAQGEILESNSFVEILQYYDSVKRADKQVRLKGNLSPSPRSHCIVHRSAPTPWVPRSHLIPLVLSVAI